MYLHLHLEIVLKHSLIFLFNIVTIIFYFISLMKYFSFSTIICKYQQCNYIEPKHYVFHKNLWHLIYPCDIKKWNPGHNLSFGVWILIYSKEGCFIHFLSQDFDKYIKLEEICFGIGLPCKLYIQNIQFCSLRFRNEN